MKKLVYKGSWPEALYGWNGRLAIILDASGSYARHSGFVQAVKRAAGEDFMVFSRKQTCYITRR